MSDTMRVFVNGRGLDAAAGGTVLDAVTQHDAADAAAVRAGSLLVTDSRGLPIAADTPLFNGAVLRLIPNRERDASDPAAQFDG
ncbi:MAG: hypothetical protein JWL95_2494 [Gemmatimonadetes bacterium]|nr:hypothetical protein [Gemmatimonadota bacterium]